MSLKPLSSVFLFLLVSVPSLAGSSHLDRNISLSLKVGKEDAVLTAKAGVRDETSLSLEHIRVRIKGSLFRRSYYLDGSSQIDHLICQKLGYQTADSRILDYKWTKRPFTLRFYVAGEGVLEDNPRNPIYIHEPVTKLNPKELIYMIELLWCTNEAG